jgi:hypothetical protein
VVTFHASQKLKMLVEEAHHGTQQRGVQAALNG